MDDVDVETSHIVHHTGVLGISNRGRSCHGKRFRLTSDYVGAYNHSCSRAYPSTPPLGWITPISFILFLLALLGVLIMVVSTIKWSKETYQLIPEARHLRPYITQAVCILPKKVALAIRLSLIH